MGHGTPDNMKWAGVLQNVLVLVHLGQVLCDPFRFSVPEEQEAGTQVGTLGKHFPPPFILLNGDYLWMDNSTGNLYTAELRMDREVLCPEQTAGECIIPHNAIVGPSGDLIQIHVIVEDINDNAPHFENKEIHLSVPEDTAVGTGILLDDQAQDRDVGRNGELKYYLQGSGGFFSLTVDKGAVVMLVVQRALDRETREQFRMSLVATDRCLDPLSATATVIVNVTDVNDNCPRFISDSPLSVIIGGETRRDTVVAWVRAVDPDIGPNAAIVYSLSPKVSERARKLFSLDSDSGLITLTQDLLSDRTEELVLQVLASGYHCPPTDTQVTVSVHPSENQVPAIEIGFIAEHQNQSIMLPENQPPTVLALLDPGGNGGFKGSSLIIEGEGPFLLSPQNGKYLLSTSKPLDYEMKREYDLSVVVSRPSAGGSASTGSRREIRVRVVDVNDNAPQFPQSHYRLEVEENDHPATPLLTLRASDADSGHNGRVTYRLDKDTAAIFRMDRLTGQLSAAVPLDREQQDVHTITVLASDGGSPRLESMTTISIYVLDQNDNAPFFMTPHFIFFIFENVPPLAQVGKVGVTDPDIGENGIVEVHVVNKSVPFVMDNAQGALRCTADIDREKEDRYELQLLASDHGHPFTLTSVARVTVFVEDVNDNQPMVILPNSNLSCLTVSLATAAGTTLAKIYATDEDTGLNSEITYTVAAREPPRLGGPFRLDPRSGNLTLAQRLVGKDLGMHHLFIVVSDGGKPVPLHTTIWVNLLVNESAEPCHLDSVPRPLPNWLAHTPSQAPICESEEGPAAKYAQLMLLAGLGAMLASICLFAGTAALYLKWKKRHLRRSRRGLVEENAIPLRLKKNSDE